jgi:16S rRNA G1207 methylase RsmC
MKTEAKAQIEQAKLAQKHEMEQMREMLKAEMEQSRQANEQGQAQEREQREAALEAMRIRMEENAREREQMMEMARARLDAETKIIVAGISAANKPVAEGQTAPKGPDMSAALTTALEGFQEAIAQINRPRKLIRDAQGRAEGIE